MFAILNIQTQERLEGLLVFLRLPRFVPFGIAHPKAQAPAGNELKYTKETVEDVSKEARDKARMVHKSIFKLDKYRELRETLIEGVTER